MKTPLPLPPTPGADPPAGQHFRKMEIAGRFGSREATREQRRVLMERVAALNATQDCKLSPFAEQLSERYIEGELSLAEVNAQLDMYYKVQTPAPM